MYKNNIDIVSRELFKNEHIVWSDQPMAKIINEGLVMSFFGIIFMAFSFFWTYSQINPNSPFNDPFFSKSLFERIFPYFSIPFFIIGVLLFLGPLWVYRSARNTIYAITNQRCLIIKSGKNITVESYDLQNDLDSIQKRERSDGSGDLIFSTKTTVSTSSNNRGQVRTHNIGFHNIKTVRDVEITLRNCIEGIVENNNF